VKFCVVVWATRTSTLEACAVLNPARLTFFKAGAGAGVGASGGWIFVAACWEG
jgi:hypothetical protein